MLLRRVRRGDLLPGPAELRLIQAPPFVLSDLILRELTHLSLMDRSARRWREVELARPDYEVAEKWLKEHSDIPTFPGDSGRGMEDKGDSPHAKNWPLRKRERCASELGRSLAWPDD